MSHRARKTDPITSHWAGADSRLRQRDMLLRAYYHLHKHRSVDVESAWGEKTNYQASEGLTADEAFAYATDMFNYTITANSYWKRISDLNANGLIYWTGDMRFSNSNHMERVFAITPLGVEMAAAMFDNNNKGE